MKKPEQLYISFPYDNILIQSTSNISGENVCGIRIENSDDNYVEDDFHFDVQEYSASFNLKKEHIQQVIDKLTEINEYIKEHPMNEEYLKYINKKKNE